MRKAINGKEEELGFNLVSRQSRRIGPKVRTYLDFEDDIALLSQEVRQAQELLSRGERSVTSLGLKINAKKDQVWLTTKSRPSTLKLRMRPTWKKSMISNI